MPEGLSLEKQLKWKDAEISVLRHYLELALETMESGPIVEDILKKHISRSPATCRRKRTEHQGGLCCSRLLKERLLQIKERSREEHERHGARRADEEDTA